MTVASSTYKSGPYDGDDTTTDFSFDFQAQQQADVQVVTTTAVNGADVDTTLTYGADFTVSLNADQSAAPGGTVTLTVAPATGTKVTILRSVQLTQGTSLPNQSAWYPKVVENALDKLTMVTQQLAEQVGRSLRVSASQAAGDLQGILTSIANSVTAAAGSASSASASATTATEQVALAAAQVVLAADQAGLATTNGAAQVALATTQAANASASATLASQWAAQLGTPVAGGEYSAKYWAQYAAATVVGQMIYRGVWDASSGAYPAAPNRGDFWKVSVAGTVSGTAYAVGDDIVFNGATWDKIDNQVYVPTPPVGSNLYLANNFGAL